MSKFPSHHKTHRTIFFCNCIYSSPSSFFFSRSRCDVGRTWSKSEHGTWPPLFFTPSLSLSQQRFPFLFKIRPTLFTVLIHFLHEGRYYFFFTLYTVTIRLEIRILKIINFINNTSDPPPNKKQERVLLHILPCFVCWLYFFDEEIELTTVSTKEKERKRKQVAFESVTRLFFFLMRTK